MQRKEGKKIFQGYWVVAGAWLAMFVSAGSQYSFAVFQPVLLEEFGWTRGMISTGFTLNMILMIGMGLIGGILVDKIGPKRTVIIGGVIGAVGMALLGSVTKLWHFILIYGALLPVGLGLSYYVVNVSTVRRWFVRRASTMVAVALTGSGLGIVFWTPVAHQFIKNFGWRTGYVWFGVFLLIGCVLGGLLLKKNPESYGLHPDGDIPSPDTDAQKDPPVLEVIWGVKDVLRTSTWWTQILGQSGYNIAIAGLLAHLITWGANDIGIPMGTMVSIYSVGFVSFAVVGRLVSGVVSDWLIARYRYSRKPMLYFCSFGVAGALFLCPAVEGPRTLIAASCLLGFCYGSGLSIWPVYLADLFGVGNLPVLFGLGGVFNGPMPALGPVLYGFSYDITGSYNTAFIITGILCVLSGIAIYFIRVPVKSKPLTV
ncbi:MAG: MFS transporter [Deltaproteobacteria bacterium]|nr:MFS transporter [Deltaproteobacteria bacterium]